MIRRSLEAKYNHIKNNETMRNKAKRKALNHAELLENKGQNRMAWLKATTSTLELSGAFHGFNMHSTYRRELLEGSMNNAPRGEQESYHES